MPVYVSAALVENRRGEVMSADVDMPSLHKLLNHVPKTIDIDEVLQRAQQLFLEFRPKLIQGELVVEEDADWVFVQYDE